MTPEVSTSAWDGALERLLEAVEVNRQVWRKVLQQVMAVPWPVEALYDPILAIYGHI